MWRSASCSERRRPALAAAVALMAVLGAPDASARRFLAREQALELAFGTGADVRREALFLTPAQLESARALAGPGVAVEGALVTRYVGRRGGAAAGTAYFDTHRVRTLPETLMVVVAPDGSVSRVEVLAFGEPADYLPRARWYEQFRRRRLDRDLALSRGVHGVTGATLSGRAATEAVRRVLAIHAALPQASP